MVYLGNIGKSRSNIEYKNLEYLNIKYKGDYYYNGIGFFNMGNKYVFCWLFYRNVTITGSA